MSLSETEGRYDCVAAALPAELPAVNRERARIVRNAIVRHFFEPRGLKVPRCWDGSARYPRQVWLSAKPTSPHANRGLARLIHDLSHGLFLATYGDTRRAHDPLHVKYELDVAVWVAERIPRWFPSKRPTIGKGAPCTKCGKERAYSADHTVNGKLACVGCGQLWPTKKQDRAAKLAKVQAAITRWTVKQKRAANKLKKLRAREKRLVTAIARGIGWEP